VFKTWCFIISIEAYTCFILVIKPHLTPEDNNAELFNLFCVLAIVVHLLWFTDFVPEANDRYMLGFSMVAFLIFNVTWNLSFIIVNSVKSVIFTIRFKCRVASNESKKKDNQEKKKQKILNSRTAIKAQIGNGEILDLKVSSKNKEAIVKHLQTRSEKNRRRSVNNTLNLLGNTNILQA